MVLFYAITRQISQHQRKVIVVGEGGDELGAYPSYPFLFLLSHLLKNPISAQIIKFYEYKVIKNNVHFFDEKIDLGFKGFFKGFIA